MRPREGGLRRGEFFGSALLQAVRSVCVSPIVFFILIIIRPIIVFVVVVTLPYLTIRGRRFTA